MIDWTERKFILDWIKQNLDGYQFRTPEAKQLRDAMQKNPLETSENIQAFGELYEQFLTMFESNPFSLKTRKGEPAAVLAKDFYYYLYPTKQNIFVPIGLQIDMGVTDTKERAQEFRGRLEKTLITWKQSFDKEEKAKKQVPDSVQADTDLQLLIRKTPAPAMYLICQVLVLAMALLCVISTVYLSRNGATDLFQTHTLQGIAHTCVAAASVVYLLKSLSWMIKEKKRRLYLKKWKTVFAQKADTPPRGFQTPEQMWAVLESIEAQTYKKPDIISEAAVEGIQEIKGGADVNLGELQNPDNRKIFYTARPVHVLAMLMITFCFLAASGDEMPALVNTIKAQAQSKTDDALILLDELMTGSQDTGSLQSSVSVRLTVSQDVVTGYSDLDAEEGYTSYGRDTVLSMLSCSRDVLGELYYEAMDDSGVISYVPASAVTLSAVNGLTVAGVRWFAKDGTEKDASGLAALFDGSALTAVELEKGDKIQITFADTVSPTGLYIINGNMGDSESADSGIRLAYLSLDDGDPWRLLLEKEINTNGYSAALPGTSLNSLVLQVVSTTGGKKNCSVSEILFCG
ncbi:MAG: hypothetical protein LUH07_16015 [Lachnospiraceae bacterium]|nr:hypothetical protein [Lachnospiraceae bacterium]